MNPSPGAIVATGFHRLVAAMVGHAIDEQAIFVVTSPTPGVGKTRSTADAVQHVPVWWVDASSAHTPTVLNLEILTAAGYQPTMKDRGIFDTTRDLGDFARDLRPVIVVDDAHQLPTESLAHLWMLHRRIGTTIGLIAKAGFGNRDRHQRELLDRADRWIEIDALPTPTMLDALIEHHPMYTTISPIKLAEIDRAHAKGRWRRWNQFTTTANRYLDIENRVLTPDVVAYTLTALAWDRRPDPLTGPRPSTRT